MSALAVVPAKTAEIVAVATALAVRTPEEATQATEFLTQIARAKKEHENARKFLVGPLNEQVQRINEAFKERAVPLDEADQLVRGKVIAFRQRQERAAAEEQARLDAERAAAEAAAEAERQAAMEAEAAALREAEAAEAARLAAADDRTRMVAELDDEDLSALIDADGNGDPELMALAEAEVVQRMAARNRAAEAERLAEEARQREIATRSAPTASVAAPEQLRAESGSATSKKRWTAEVVDETLVPREFLKVDKAAINKAVRAGARDIPGVKIEQVDELAVRAA